MFFNKITSIICILLSVIALILSIQVSRLQLKVNALQFSRDNQAVIIGDYLQHKGKVDTFIDMQKDVNRSNLSLWETSLKITEDFEDFKQYQGSINTATLELVEKKLK